MSIGSTVAVESAMEQYREDCAKVIAKQAAQLVAARDMSRDDAIQAATEWLRRENEAEGDVTGILAIENEHPSPSKVVPSNQIAAIERDLLDAAREAADTL